MKSELGKSQREVLLEAAKSFNQHDIQWCILRRHELLPEAIPGTNTKEFDIDILIDDNDYDDAIDLVQSHGFVRQNNNRVVLLKKAARNPKRSLEMLINSPTDIIQRLDIPLPGFKDRSPSEWASEGTYVHLMKKDGIVLDLRNHLSHISAWGSRRVRLDPKLESGLLNRRQERGDLFVPEPADELAHVLGHVLFDYEGNISKYYENRCEALAEDVLNNKHQSDIFKHNLRMMFFSADEFVYDKVVERSFNELRNELISYSDY